MLSSLHIALANDTLLWNFVDRGNGGSGAASLARNPDTMLVGPEVDVIGKSPGESAQVVARARSGLPGRSSKSSCLLSVLIGGTVSLMYGVPHRLAASQWHSDGQEGTPCWISRLCIASYVAWNAPSPPSP